MKNTAFSLMTALLAVMNESEPKDPYYVLAQYFLYHFDQLRDLNIYDVADACYVSRSGIRRFCQSIGFDNFSDMKAEADEWQRQCNYFIGYSVRPNYKEYLSSTIEGMMAEINRLATPAVMDKLAERSTQPLTRCRQSGQPAVMWYCSLRISPVWRHAASSSPWWSWASWYKSCQMRTICWNIWKS